MLGDFLRTAAAAHADRPALRLGDASMSFAELDRAAACFATRLTEHGVKPGDRVAVMLPNVPAFAVAYYGVLYAGGAVISCNPLHKAREMAHQLDDAGAALIVTMTASEAAAKAGGVPCLVSERDDLSDLLADEPAEPVSRESGDPAMLLYTAATDGTPKAAVLTHGNLVSNAQESARVLGLDTDSVQLGALPLFHGFGQTVVLNASVVAGACVTLVPRFEPEKVLATMERDGVTMFAGVPTMFAALAFTAEKPIETLELCLAGGAKLEAPIREGFEARFGVELREGYGLTEAAPVVSFNRPPQPLRPGTVGTALDGVELRIVDDEVHVKGPNVMQGYWGDPEATAAVLDDEGWLATGDTGTLDDEGYLTLTGRKKDLIIRGGYNVYPAEVERVLREHPAVADCRVFGVPNPLLGEEVGVEITVNPGTALTPRDVRAHVRAEIASYKSPTQITIDTVDA